MRNTINKLTVLVLFLVLAFTTSVNAQEKNARFYKDSLKSTEMYKAAEAKIFKEAKRKGDQIYYLTHKDLLDMDIDSQARHLADSAKTAYEAAKVEPTNPSETEVSESPFRDFIKGFVTALTYIFFGIMVLSFLCVFITIILYLKMRTLKKKVTFKSISADKIALFHSTLAPFGEINTPINFINKYELHPDFLYEVVNGNKKNHHGWALTLENCMLKEK